MNLELVTWIDSIRHSDGWQSVEHYQRESERSMSCETVGWIIHETDESLIVAQSRMTWETPCVVTEVIQIPKTAVTTRLDLGETIKKARGKA